MRIEIKKETVYQITLTRKEIDTLFTLSGNLTKQLATKHLGMTEEQYKMTSDMYDNISNIV